MRLDELEEAEVKKVVFTFGRLNPPHFGHHALIQTLQKAAQKQNCDWFLFVSSKTGDEKNPLTYEQKVWWIQALFPETKGHLIIDQKIKTPLVAATWLFNQGYRAATFVAGEDDMASYGEMIKSGNAHGQANPNALKAGKGFVFNPLDFAISPRLASATNARRNVTDGDPEAFVRSILGPKINPQLAELVQNQLYPTLRKALGLTEGISESYNYPTVHEIAAKHMATPRDVYLQLNRGVQAEFEKEHDIETATDIAMHNIADNLEHYREMVKIEDVGSNVLDKPTANIIDLSEKYNVSPFQVEKELRNGIKVEMEHTNHISVAREIALDHLSERLDYYEQLAKAEKVTEVADQPYRFISPVSTATTQKSMFQTDSGTTIQVFIQVDTGNGVADIGFFDATDKENPTIGVTGKGDAFRVFATVGSIVKQFVAKRKPPYISFSGKSSDAGRIKLYDMIAKNIGRYLPEYKLIDSGFANGDKGYTFKRVAQESVSEVAKVKLSSDPNNFGAWVNDSGKPEKTIMIPINKLSGFEPDSKFDDPSHAKNLAKIVKAIKAGKELPPILVRRHGVDRFQVLDGHHRFKAYRMAGMKSIPARLVDPKNVSEESDRIAPAYAKMRPFQIVGGYGFETQIHKFEAPSHSDAERYAEKWAAANIDLIPGKAKRYFVRPITKFVQQPSSWTTLGDSIEEDIGTKLKDLYHHLRYTAGGDEEHKYKKSKYKGKGKPDTHHDPYKNMSDSERGHTIRARSSDADHAREFIARRDNPRVDWPEESVSENVELTPEDVYKKNKLENLGISFEEFERYVDQAIEHHSKLYTYWHKFKDHKKAYHLAQQEVLKNLYRNKKYYMSKPVIKTDPIDPTMSNSDWWKNKISEEKKPKKPKTIIDGALKTLIAKGRSEDEAIADLKKEIDSKFYELDESLNERKMADLYHSTDIDNLAAILKSGQLTPGRNVYVSLTRDKNYLFAKDSSLEYAVFVIDQAKLAYNKKIEPYDFHMSDEEDPEDFARDVEARRSESEERVKGPISLKYVKAIMMPVSWSPENMKKEIEAAKQQDGDDYRSDWSMTSLVKQRCGKKLRIIKTFQKLGINVNFSIEENLEETLKKVKGEWALVSRKNPKKVLQYYHGSGHPSKDWVSKVERRVHSFESIQEDESARPLVYLDMDGVLADFFGDWSKISGVSHYKDISNVEQALQLVRDHPTFWIDLPLLPNARALVKTVIEKYGEYRICSTPLAGDGRSKPGKIAWINKHFADMPPAEVVLTHNKAERAQHNGVASILVDDFGSNIDKWKAAGGIGIKYEDSAFPKVATILTSIAKSGVPK